MGYHDYTQIFIIEKYGILALKWRVVSIFSTPRSKLISKKQKVDGELAVKLSVFFFLGAPGRSPGAPEPPRKEKYRLGKYFFRGAAPETSRPGKKKTLLC